MTERFEVFVVEYHWMMVDCLLSLTLYFSEIQSSDFFENKRKKNTVIKYRKTANLFLCDLHVVEQHYFASSSCCKPVSLWGM